MEVKSGDGDSIITNSIVKSILRCYVCTKVYSDPRLLPCLHTICKSCVSDLVRSSDDDTTFRCPVCRMSLVLPASGADGLPKNLHSARLTEMFPCREASRFCSVCQLSGRQVSSVRQCLDCLDFLCKKCAKGHVSSSFTATHRVVSRDVLLSGKYDVNILKSQTTICGEHKQEVQMYCKSCRCLMCIQCAVTQHLKHNTAAINSAADSVKQDLQNIIRESSAWISTLENKSDFLLSKEKTRQHSEKQKLSEVNKQVDNIISKIKKEGEIIVKQIKDHCAKQGHEYSLASGALESLMTSARDTVSLCDHVIARGSDVEVLLLHDTLKGRVKIVDEIDKQLHLDSLGTNVTLEIQTRTPDWQYFTVTDINAPVVKDDKLSRNESKYEKLIDSGSCDVPTGKDHKKLVNDTAFCEKQHDFHSLIPPDPQCIPSSSDRHATAVYALEAFYRGKQEQTIMQMIMQIIKDNSSDVFLYVVLVVWFYLATHVDIFTGEADFYIFACACLWVCGCVGVWVVVWKLVFEPCYLEDKQHLSGLAILTGVND